MATEQVKKLLLLSSTSPGTGISTLANLLKTQSENPAIQIPAGGKILRAIAQKYLLLEKEQTKKKQGLFSLEDYSLILKEKAENNQVLEFLIKAILIEFNNLAEGISEKEYREIFLKKLTNNPSIEIFDEITDSFPLLVLKQLIDDPESVKELFVEEENQFDFELAILEGKLAIFLGLFIETELFSSIAESYEVVRIALTVSEHTAAWRVLYREIAKEKLDFQGKKIKKEEKQKLLALLTPFLNCDRSPEQLQQKCDEAQLAFASLQEENQELADWLIEKFKEAMSANTSRMKIDDKRWQELYGENVTVSNISKLVDHQLDTTQLKPEEVLNKTLNLIN